MAHEVFAVLSGLALIGSRRSASPTWIVADQTQDLRKSTWPERVNSVTCSRGICPTQPGDSLFGGKVELTTDSSVDLLVEQPSSVSDWTPIPDLHWSEHDLAKLFASRDDGSSVAKW